MFNYFPRRTSRQEDYTHLKSFSEDEMPFRYALVHDVQQFCAEIPMRLSLEERSVMRLIQGIFNASRYTDRIDTPASSHNPENQRDSTAIAKHRALQLKEIFSVCLALLSGIDRTYTTILLSDVRSLKKMEGELQRLFEYIRRYKIVNPDLLRTDYGKVLYLLQDSVQEPIRQELGFCLVGTIRTVGSFCEEHGLKELLNDPLLPLCTTPVPFHSNRVTLNNALRFKSAAIRRIVQKYRGVSGCSCDDIETVVYSIADANQYAQDNAGSVQHFLDVIREYFSPDPPQRSEFDLGITAGTHGSRLTHNHTEQFHFVQQTLTLWRNILRQMFALWTLAEREFLDCSCPYSFRNTGQGYHRVQHKATATRQAIERIIESTRREVGTWVGSHRVHLGDDQVPNGFYFLDKYAQVSRIINPILLVFKHIDTMCDDRNRSEKDFIERTWKSADRLKRVILTDFLRFGFDGSGGDNMDDAGSCIDGRLTSAWNWCSEIHLKPFYPFFVLAGVNSFDGDLHT